MSFVTTQPAIVAATVGSLQAIGSGIGAKNSAAAKPTTELIPAATDEVSALTTQFAMHATMYQTISAEAAAAHQQFVSTLSSGAAAYAATVAARRYRDRLSHGRW